MRILIIAGNEIEQAVLKLVLAKLDMQADIDDRGANAVRLCEENTYDAIIADLASFDRSRMPIFRSILKLTYPNQPTLIAVTNDESKEERENCLRLGFSSYISKPYSLAQIQQALTSPSKGGDRHDGEK